MKIYKYRKGEMPQCCDSGEYFPDATHSIGFGSNNSTASEGVIELTEIDFIAHVTNLSYQRQIANLTIDDKKRQYGEYIVPPPNLTFLGFPVKTAKDVGRIVSRKITEDMSASQGSIDIVGDNLKIISEMIALLMAYSGKIPFNQTGIEGVTDIASADAYIASFYTANWAQRNSYRQQAKQFIQENNLQ